jgi:RHS repeat-associated protein
MLQVNQDRYHEIASVPTVYLYDGINSLEEIDNSGNILARYTQGSGTDQPLAELRSGTTSYYQQDALSSVTSLSSSAGALANTYTYDSYGKLTASTGTLTNPFQYTGREFDPETGIFEYRARYFDPAVGRFISEDPVRFRSGVDFYAYVDNNPVGEIDPLGLLPKNKDKWWGYNDDHFHKWWHRCYWTNMPFDGTREDVETAYEIWESLGKPQNGDCGGKKEPCPQEEPVPETEPIPNPNPTKVLTWSLILGTGAAIAEEYGWVALFF